MLSLAPNGPIPVGRSTWWAGVKSGRFPKPVKLGPRTTAWKVEDARALLLLSRTASKRLSSAWQRPYYLEAVEDAAVTNSFMADSPSCPDLEAMMLSIRATSRAAISAKRICFPTQQDSPASLASIVAGTRPKVILRPLHGI
jgi:hypothetical protein